MWLLGRIVHAPNSHFLGILESHLEHSVSRLTAARIDPFLNGRKMLGGISHSRIGHARSTMYQTRLPYLHLVKTEGRPLGDPYLMSVTFCHIFTSRITPTVDNDELIPARLCNNSLLLSAGTVPDKTNIVLYLAPKDFNRLEPFSSADCRKCLNRNY